MLSLRKNIRVKQNEIIGVKQQAQSVLPASIASLCNATRVKLREVPQTFLPVFFFYEGNVRGNDLGYGNIEKLG